MQISQLNSYLKPIDQMTGDALNNQSIFFSIDLVIGDSEEDVERRYGELAALIPIDHAITYLARF